VVTTGRLPSFSRSKEGIPGDRLGFGGDRGRVGAEGREVEGRTDHTSDLPYRPVEFRGTVERVDRADALIDPQIGVEDVVADEPYSLGYLAVSNVGCGHRHASRSERVSDGRSTADPDLDDRLVLAETGTQCVGGGRKMSHVGTFMSGPG